MYEPDTILELKKPHPNDPETDEPFPYNRVKVVGPSPINHGIANAEWTGAGGAGVIITPLTNFGSTLDEPYGKLTALYDVVEVPVRETDVQPKIRVINSTSQSAGPTPEEVFAEKAPGKAPQEGQRRARTSPLEDPRPKASDGPLGSMTPEQARAEAEAARKDTGVTTTTEVQ
jgi:hypothetical protein